MEPDPDPFLLWRIGNCRWKCECGDTFKRAQDYKCHVYIMHKTTVDKYEGTFPALLKGKLIGCFKEDHIYCELCLDHNRRGCGKKNFLQVDPKVKHEMHSLQLHFWTKHGCTLMEYYKTYVNQTYERTEIEVNTIEEAIQDDEIFTEMIDQIFKLQQQVQQQQQQHQHHNVNEPPIIKQEEIEPEQIMVTPDYIVDPREIEIEQKSVAIQELENEKKLELENIRKEKDLINEKMKELEKMDQEKELQWQTKLKEQELQWQTKLKEQELQWEMKLKEQELQWQMKLKEQELQWQMKLKEQEFQWQMKLKEQELQLQKEMHEQITKLRQRQQHETSSQETQTQPQQQEQMLTKRELVDHISSQISALKEKILSQEQQKEKERQENLDCDFEYVCKYCNLQMALTKREIRDHVSTHGYSFEEYCTIFDDKLLKSGRGQKRKREASVINDDSEKGEKTKSSTQSQAEQSMKEKKRICCPICTKSFAHNKGDLKLHIKRVHEGNRKTDWYCPVCQIYFPRKTLYETHMKRPKHLKKTKAAMIVKAMEDF